MRFLGRSVCALALGLILASPALAQQRGFRGGFGGAGFLVANESVQKELKLNDDQIAKIRDLNQSVRDKYSSDFQNFQGLSQDERRELMEKIGTETRKGLADILKPEQQKRLDQIQLQQQGVEAFASPDLQSKLNLTSEQKEKIQAIAEDARQQLADARPQPGGDFQEALTKIRSIRKDALTKATALLSADQKKSWEELTGAPFEVQFQPRRPQSN
jgi:Spy/CpxP family protein refolding chaperone